jgi:UDP-glucose 6-dehydrogenase
MLFLAFICARGSEGGKRIAMIGAGHVGLVPAACFADFGHQVICVDKGTDKISALTGGRYRSMSRA